MFRMRALARPRTIAWSRVMTVGLVVVALACGWWSLQRGVAYARLALAYPAPLDGQEGMALWEAALLRTGQPLYQPVTPDRFVSAPYPPLHPLALAIFGGSTAPHVFWAGRVISLIAALLVAVAGGLLAREVTRSRLAGVAASVLILSFVPLQLWALRIKPDMLGLAFTVTGLWLVARWRDHDSPPGASGGRAFRRLGLSPGLIAGAFAFACAHFTKQTLLAGPMAAGTYLLLLNWRVALRWSLAYLAFLAIAWLTLDLVTHGQYTYHVWILHKLPWYVHRFTKLAAQLRDAWPLMILGALGLGACLRRPTVINAYLLWAPASLVGAGVVGSHHNHLLETGVALALAGGQAIGVGLARPGALRIVAPALVATQLLFWRAPLPWFAGEFAPEHDYARYIRFIEQTPGEILADDVGLLYAAGRPLRYDDPAAMGPAAAIGLWDPSNLVAEIRAQRFTAILLEIDVFADGIDDAHDRWTPEMLDAVRDAYEIKFRDTVIIYAPRPMATP